VRPGETEIEMVRRHVREGASTITRQQRLIARLLANGFPTDVALQMLRQFEQSQRQHQEHLDRLESVALGRP
jgi:hypothetical protein